MICFLKHIKGIAYFLITLILFQSCTIYQRQTSTVPQATESNDGLIKIKTINGVKYKLKWIEKEGGNIVSIKYTKREYINKNDIVQIVKYDPEPQVISFDSLRKQKGAVQILTKDKKGKHKAQDFIKTVAQGDELRAYSMTGTDTLTIVIPIDQIEQIQLQNNEGSRTLTTLTVFGGAVAFGMICVILGLKYYP